MILKDTYIRIFKRFNEGKPVFYNKDKRLVFQYNKTGKDTYRIIKIVDNIEMGTAFMHFNHFKDYILKLDPFCFTKRYLNDNIIPVDFKNKEVL